MDKTEENKRYAEMLQLMASTIYQVTGDSWYQKVAESAKYHLEDYT